ncbi:helix-turn-helix domain-containing protein [Microbacterium lacticum]
MDQVQADSLRRVVREHREAQELSQEELGIRSGYGKGAGVSINRFENGLVLPRPDRLDRIARALGFTVEALLSEAQEEPGTSQPRKDLARGAELKSGEKTKDRAARIQREIDSRTSEVRVLVDGLVIASEAASRKFSVPRGLLASRIRGLPDEPIYPATTQQNPARAAERAVELLVASGAQSSARGKPIAGARLSPAADSVLRAVLSTGLTARRGFGGATIATTLVAAVAGGLIVGGLAAMTTRSQQAQRELKARLDDAERKLDRLRPGIEALKSLIPDATRMLDYVAVHAGHAFARYAAGLDSRGDGTAIEWAELTNEEHERFKLFAEIEVAQNALSGIDIEGLLWAPDAESRESMVAQTTGLISSCQAAIISRV